jgi:hypothetical protein
MEEERGRMCLEYGQLVKCGVRLEHMDKNDISITNKHWPLGINVSL